MIATPTATAPTQPLFRIGRSPNPLDWPPLERAGSGRFDDPRREFRTLYVAEQRVGCFVETLARFRPDLEFLASRANIPDSEEPAAQGSPRIPEAWCEQHLVGRLTLRAGQRWLDLRSFKTRELLRGELAALLMRLGLADLDVAGIRGPTRELTQAIARWAYEHKYRGMAFKSRFDDAFDCWAIFEGATFEPVFPFERISRDDPDLRAAAVLFGLTF